MLIKSGLIVSRNLYTVMTASSRAKLALTNAAPECADADADVVVRLQPMFKFMMLMIPSCGSEILYLLVNVATFMSRLTTINLDTFMGKPGQGPLLWAITHGGGDIQLLHLIKVQADDCHHRACDV